MSMVEINDVQYDQYSNIIYDDIDSIQYHIDVYYSDQFYDWW